MDNLELTLTFVCTVGVAQPEIAAKAADNTPIFKSLQNTAITERLLK